MDPTTQLRNSLASSSLPIPSPAFLSSLTTTASTPASTLLSTARTRILSCDLTQNTILDASLASLPLGIDSPRTDAARLPRAVHVQVLDVENLSLSRWEQVEELEAVERGEGTRGREVVRVQADEDAVPESQQTQQRGGGGRAAGAKATHRLVLQDCKGMKIFGVELKRMDGVGVGVGRTGIGEKILLREGTTVARGVVLLTPEDCVLLGGRVEEWHKAWMDGRLARLKEAVGSDRPI